MKPEPKDSDYYRFDSTTYVLMGILLLIVLIAALKIIFF
jgi:hypothetical protein